MIGSRATSGSVAITFRKVAHRLLAVEQVGVHVDVEDVRAAAHLLERDLDRAGEVVGLDQRGGSAPSRSRSCARRSATKPVSGPISNGSRPLQRGRRCVDCRGTGSRRERRGPRRRSRAVCSGVEPQQLPAMLRKPALGELAEQRARHLGRLVVAAERVRQAGVRVAARRGTARACASSATYGRISFAPSEQLMPTISGSACSIEIQNASIVCPESVAAREVDDRRRDPERHVRAPSRARPRSPPSRSACRRSSRAAAGRRRPRRAPRSARRRRPSPRRRCACGTPGRRRAG